MLLIYLNIDAHQTVHIFCEIYVGQAGCGPRFEIQDSLELFDVGAELAKLLLFTTDRQNLRFVKRKCPSTLLQSKK